MDLAALPFITAKWFAPDTNRHISVIVLHTAECPQTENAAQGVAEYFASGSEGRKASAHYVVDSSHVIHCVQNKDIAYGAPGANARGLHIEHAGYAAQTGEQWKSIYNVAMLKLSAQLTAALCKEYGISAIWLSPQDVRDGKEGITGHAEVTLAFPEMHGTHHDPGAGFPAAGYIELVKEAMK